ncbi:MAG: hypothetical protein JWO63_3288 [Frankiales bacterium]|nr:hypothetical protein [Frankiales bacterium]
MNAALKRTSVATVLLSTVALIVAVLVAAGPHAASAAGSTGSSVDLCGAPSPGYAQCLGIRHLPRAAATPNSATGNASPANSPLGLTPSQLASAYDLDRTQGAGQRVAIVDAYDDPSAASDLAVYRSQWGLPPCTSASGCLAKVNQDGAASPLPTADAGWAAEISLDLDMVSAICPKCGILLVEADSNALSDLGAAVDTAVQLGAKFVSNSYGGPEQSWASAADSYYDHPGVAITASTGDDGYGVFYPASSPYVTAVGGTSLVPASNARGWTETAWQGAGSGCSSYSSQPAMQASANTGCADRAVADVSAIADPNTGVAVYDSYGNGGGWAQYGGTSAAAPIIASTYALAGTPGASDYPNSYPSAHQNDLNDVTAGSDCASGVAGCTGTSCATLRWCTAAAGWDGPTGLGTPSSTGAFTAPSTTPVPAAFSGVATVASDPVAGLGTQLTFTPTLPSGQSIATVSWSVARSDCAIAAPTLLQTTVRCPADATGATTVTASASDTAGAHVTASAPLTFGPADGSRPVAVALSATGQTGSTMTFCAGTPTPVQAVVTDQATGEPVQGITVAFTSQADGAEPTTVGTAVTDAQGLAQASLTATTDVQFGASTSAAGAFAADGPVSIAATAASCTGALSSALNQILSYYGDPVTVTGSLTETAGQQQLPAVGRSVSILETSGSTTSTLGAAVTGADGAFTAVIHPTASGSISVAAGALGLLPAISAVAGDLTVQLPTTAATAAANHSEIAYLSPLTVSGSLTRVAGSATRPLAAASVRILGRVGTAAATQLATAVTNAQGAWSVSVSLKASQTISAVYAGAAGQPAATATAGAVRVAAWTTKLALAVSRRSLAAGDSDAVSGTATRSYAGASSAAAALPVRVYLTTRTGTTLLLATTSTTSAGRFAATVRPTENGTLTARVVSVPGYANSTSAGIAVTVSTRVAAAAPARVARHAAFLFSTSVTVARRAGVTIEVLRGTRWVRVTSATTASNGVAHVRVAGLAAGTYHFRSVSVGDARGGAGVSATVIVRVP